MHKYSFIEIEVYQAHATNPPMYYWEWKVSNTIVKRGKKSYTTEEEALREGQLALYDSLQVILNYIAQDIK